MTTAKTPVQARLKSGAIAGFFVENMTWEEARSAVAATLTEQADPQLHPQCVLALIRGGKS